jgi:hypothetical protein
MVLERVYRPDAYFERLRIMARALDRPIYSRPSLKGLARALHLLARLAWLMTMRRRELRPYFWRTLIDIARHNIGTLQYVVAEMILYLHLGRFARFVIAELERQVEAEHAELAHLKLLQA